GTSHWHLRPLGVSRLLFFLLALSRSAALLVLPLGCRVKIAVHGTCHRLRHPRHSAKSLKRRLTYLFQAPEVPEQLGLSLFTHAWDICQGGTQLLALAQRLMIGDGKTVRLITYPLQQEEGRGIDREDHGVLAPRTIKPLIAVPACARGL